MANLLYRIRLGPVYTYPHILIPKTDIFPLVLRRCPHVKGFSGTKIAGFRADRLRVDRRNGSSRIRLIPKEEREFKHRKLRKIFRAPRENQTHDPPSSSSDALTTEQTGIVYVL